MKFTKISKELFDSLQTGAGILLKTFSPESPALNKDDVICVTSGGISASCTPQYTDFGEDVDGCKNGMRENKRLISFGCEMSFTALGVSQYTVRTALGAADVNSENGQIVPRKKLKNTDFQSVWWVGDRLDGGLVAIELVNALTTTGFSLKTVKSGKGNLSVTLSGHISANNTKVVPMNFWSLIATESEEPGVPEEPDTPTVTSYYLYGQVADSVVTYNGVTLPDIESVWTDKETYPYAFIIYNTAYACYRLFFFNGSISWDGAYVFYFSGAYSYYTLVDGAWTFSDSQDSGYHQHNSDGNWNWSNFDLKGYSSDDLYFAASDPVKSYTDPDVFVGDVGYVGAVLPALPEWDKETYPYAVIIFNENDAVCRLYLCANQWEWLSNNVFSGAKWQINGIYQTYTARLEEIPYAEWEFEMQEDSTDATLEVNETSTRILTWCNTDIIRNGEAYLAASYPVALVSGYVLNDVVKTFTVAESLTTYETDRPGYYYGTYRSYYDSELGFDDEFCWTQYPLGTQFRVTFNGVEKIYPLSWDDQYGCVRLGNKHLEDPDNYEDDGFPAYISQVKYSSNNYWGGINTTIYTTMYGDFTLTIESLVTTL